MEETLSNSTFSSNTTLWGKKKNADERIFHADEEKNAGSFFEVKPLSFLDEETASSEYEVIEEAELIDEASSDSREVDAESAELNEPRISFTESEYESLLKEKLAEAELRVKERLEVEFNMELDRLSLRQSDFFAAILSALRSENLTSEIADISLKIGSFLARSQLQINESVISDFVSSALEDLSHADSQHISVQVCREWENYLSALSKSDSSGLNFTYEDTLVPGDIIVTAGNSGYLDLLDERMKQIEDQLRSTPPSSKGKYFIDALRKSFSEAGVDEEGVIDSPTSTENSADSDEVLNESGSELNRETEQSAAESGFTIKKSMIASMRPSESEPLGTGSPAPGSPAEDLALYQAGQISLDEYLERVLPDYVGQNKGGHTKEEANDE